MYLKEFFDQAAPSRTFVWRKRGDKIEKRVEDKTPMTLNTRNKIVPQKAGQ